MIEGSGSISLTNRPGCGIREARNIDCKAHLLDEVVDLAGGCGGGGGGAHGRLQHARVHVQVLKLLLKLVHHLPHIKNEMN